MKTMKNDDFNDDKIEMKTIKINHLTVILSDDTIRQLLTDEQNEIVGEMHSESGEMQKSVKRSEKILSLFSNWIQWCGLSSSSSSPQHDSTIARVKISPTHDHAPKSIFSFFDNSTTTKNERNEQNEHNFGKSENKSEEATVFSFGSIQNLSFYHVGSMNDENDEKTGEKTDEKTEEENWHQRVFREQFLILKREMDGSTTPAATVAADASLSREHDHDSDERKSLLNIPSITFFHSQCESDGENNCDEKLMVKKFQLLDYETCGRPFLTRVTHRFICDHLASETRKTTKEKKHKKKQKQENEKSEGMKNEKPGSNQKQCLAVPAKKNGKNLPVETGKNDTENEDKEEDDLEAEAARRRNQMNSIVENMVRTTKEESFPEPELILVFSPNVCCLHGFSPIHLRYTQIIHVTQSIQQFTYRDFVRCLLQYAGCEQRYGV